MRSEGNEPAGLFVSVGEASAIFAVSDTIGPAIWAEKSSAGGVALEVVANNEQEFGSHPGTQ